MRCGVGDIEVPVNGEGDLSRAVWRVIALHSISGHGELDANLWPILGDIAAAGRGDNQIVRPCKTTAGVSVWRRSVDKVVARQAEPRHVGCFNEV
jgi:hypothetical protein